MWDNKYEPPESIFDEIEPVACIVFVIALFAVILFTPLSPFSSRDQSALDQIAGVNRHTREAGVRNQDKVRVRVRQVDAGTESGPVIR